ncbi:MAG TPA: AAA family ATPase, partial [Myxococcaceae bacterium]|nr:AAA family ATPase [Myxococcaceae bacterium]
MTFVTARPSLPSGHALPGLPGIEKPLHADGAVEIYRLADASERVLLVVPATAEPRAQARARLVPWWELLGQERVVVEKELGGPSFSAVLRLKGEWMASDRRKAAAGEQALLEMFGALLEAAGLTLRSPTPLGRPSLARSLIWWNAGGGGRATPVYLGAAAPAERDLVRDAAALVYLDASGIDPSKAKGPPAPLDRWVKTAGAQATSALGRCLSNGQDRIATLADARRAAGLDRGGDGAAEVEAKPVADRHGTGLAAVAGMKELRTLLEKEVVRPIRDPEPFKKYGLDIPNGILLYGPPGCGKTWIARKLAEEVGHFFVEIIPSEIASPYIHDSVIRIRELFD